VSPRAQRLALCATLLASAGAAARAQLDFDTLMSGSYPKLVDFSAFAPDAGATAPAHRFEGVLELQFTGTLAHHTLHVDPAEASAQDVARALTWPGDFAYEFVQQGGVLVPVRRGAIPGTHGWWELILEPGRVWNEAGDRGFTRASIPFALQQKNANCTHNGVLMFLFRSDGAVSRTAMQIASETCQYLQLDLWGLLASHYRPGRVTGREAALLAHAREVQARVPYRTLAQLHADHPQLDVPALAIGAAAGRTVYGLVIGGVEYLSGCETRSGAYPYCDVIDLPSYSLAKSVFAAAALMRLQQSQPGAAAQLISAHVPECSTPAWNGVTFAQALDMATGNYAAADYEADEYAASTSAFFFALDHLSKIRFGCGAYPHRAAPGSKWVYHTSDTYVLGSALAHYLRSRPGHERDDLFSDLVYAQLYAPLRLSATAGVMRRSYDKIAQPFAGWGLTFQPGDITKLAQFIGTGHGAIDGRQLLDASMLDQALQRDPASPGLPVTGFPGLRYHYGFWARNLRSELGCAHETWVPFMSGFGGISVVLFPNGVVYFNFADDGQAASFDWAPVAPEVRKLGDYCR
jgi:hypothetical protein